MRKASLGWVAAAGLLTTAMALLWVVGGQPRDVRLADCLGLEGTNTGDDLTLVLRGVKPVPLAYLRCIHRIPTANTVALPLPGDSRARGCR